MSFALPTYHFDENLREIPDDLDKWKISAVVLQETLEITDAPYENLVLLENLGFVLRVLGRLDEAEAMLKEALSLSSDHPNPLRSLQNMMRLAHVYQWKKDFKKANGIFSDVKKMLKGSGVSDGILSTFHLHFGKLLFDQEKFKEAESHFKMALEIRETIKAPQDQVSSSRFALEQARKRTENL